VAFSASIIEGAASGDDFAQKMCGCITGQDALRGFSKQIRQRFSMVEDEEANLEEK
jgi:hypothetical protein